MKVTVAWVSPAVAVPMVGAPGTTAFTVKVWVTVVAAFHTVLPTWSASIVQLPAVTKVSAPPLVMVQTPGVDDVKVGARLEVAEAVVDDWPDGKLEPLFVFVTAFDEFAVAAFERAAVDYLLKPFSHERFVEAVAHAAQQLGAAPSTAALAQALAQPQAPLERILVRDQGKIFPLQVEAIEYLRADLKYTAIISRGRQFLVRLPITAFEQRLDPARFLKLQRSCIVNLDFVEAMSPDESSQLVVQMSDGARFTASREVSKRLREQSI